MSISRVNQKQADYSSSMSTKLSDTASRLDRCKSEQPTLIALKERHVTIFKNFALLTLLYSRRFLIAFTVNLLIFIGISTVFLAPQKDEIILLLGFNYMALSTMFLSSALAFNILDRMDKLNLKINDLSNEVKEFTDNKSGL